MIAAVLIILILAALLWPAGLRQFLSVIGLIFALIVILILESQP